MGWGREGKVEYDFDPDWSLQHDCLAFSQGIKGRQGQPEILFYNIWLWNVELFIWMVNKEYIFTNKKEKYTKIFNNFN